MPNVAKAAVGSSLTAVPILARIEEKPYAKKPNKIEKTTKGARWCASPQEVKQATAVTMVERRTKGFRPILSESMPKVHWPTTCAALITDSSMAPFFALRPIDVAYEGKKSDGKKNPKPCVKLAKQYTRNKGFEIKDQSVFVTALACEGGSLLRIRGIRGPVRTTMATAIARKVVL